MSNSENMKSILKKKKKNEAIIMFKVGILEDVLTLTF